MLTPDVVLSKAADIIEVRGHAHEYYVDNEGQVCAIGAIRIVCGAPIAASDPKSEIKYYIDTFDGKYDDAAAQAARTQLEEYLNINPMNSSVVEWNDDRDKQTVVNALREAAKMGKAE